MKLKQFKFKLFQTNPHSKTNMNESQILLVESKEKLCKEYENIIVRKAVTIHKHENTIIHQQEIIEALEKKRDQMTEEMKSKDQRINERDQIILKLEQENHALKIKMEGTLQEMKTMITELWQESKRRRT